jgi:hypothetical protein
MCSARVEKEHPIPGSLAPLHRRCLAASHMSSKEGVFHVDITAWTWVIISLTFTPGRWTCRSFRYRPVGVALAVEETRDDEKVAGDLRIVLSKFNGFEQNGYQ